MPWIVILPRGLTHNLASGNIYLLFYFCYLVQRYNVIVNVYVKICYSL